MKDIDYYDYITSLVLWICIAFQKNIVLKDIFYVNISFKCKIEKWELVFLMLDISSIYMREIISVTALYCNAKLPLIVCFHISYSSIVLNVHFCPFCPSICLNHYCQVTYNIFCPVSFLVKYLYKEKPIIQPL